MISRIAEILVILALRLTFTIPNKRRDKLFADGDERYDPNVTTYEDVTDKQNLHFRYLCEYYLTSVWSGLIHVSLSGQSEQGRRYVSCVRPADFKVVQIRSSRLCTFSVGLRARNFACM